MQNKFLELLRNDAHKVGQYKLSSGRTSEHYINCKPVILSGKGLAMVSDMILDRDLSALIVRKEPKGHGTGAWIEGPVLPEGSKIVVLEDVITTGGSSIKAATRLRDAGYEVNRIVTIVDRQVNNEANDFMESVDLELISLYKLQDIANASDKP